MSEKEKATGKQDENVLKRQSDTNFEKGKHDEGFGRYSPIPKSWQPTKDDTDPNPPDGGSGVGDSKE